MAKKKLAEPLPRMPTTSWTVVDKTRPRQTVPGCKVVQRGLTLREAADFAKDNNDYKIVSVQEEEDFVTT